MSMGILLHILNLHCQHLLTEKEEEHFSALFKILKTCTTVTEGVLTVTSGKVFLMRLNILLWDCRSPIVRGSLAPSLVLPFDFSFRLFPSRTAFTYGEKTQLTFHMLREFKGYRCTQRYTFGFFRDYTLIVSKAKGWFTLNKRHNTIVVIHFKSMESNVIFVTG